MASAAVQHATIALALVVPVGAARIGAVASRVSRIKWQQQVFFGTVARPFTPSDPKQSARSAIYFKVEETITRSDRWSQAGDVKVPPMHDFKANASSETEPQKDDAGVSATLASNLGFHSESIMDTFLLAFGLATGSLVYLVSARVL